MEALLWRGREWRNPAVFSSPPAPSRLRSRRPELAPPSPGRKVSSLATSAAFENNVLLSSAAKRGPLDRALALFCLVRDRDTVTWNTVLSACLHGGRPGSAVELFVEMLRSGKDHPDAITIRTVLNACLEMHEFGFGRQVHAYVDKFGRLVAEDLTVIYTCLLNLYCESGDFSLVRHLFDRIPRKDVVAFTSMMACFNKAGEYEAALKTLLRLMDEDEGSIQLNEYALSCALRASSGMHSLSAGRQLHAHAIKLSLGSHNVVGTALLHMYAKCDKMRCAKSAFMCIYEPNIAAWNALLDGCSLSSDALNLFSTMRLTGTDPDCTTFATVLRACEGCSLHIIQQIHGLLIKEMPRYLDAFIGSALFMNYIGQDCVKEAQKVFDDIQVKDAVAYKLGVTQYVQKGLMRGAVSLSYECLESIGEESLAAVTALVLGVGNLNQGKQLHALAAKVAYGSAKCSSIYDALTRMYAKHNCITEAMRIFSYIDEPDVVSWTSLISAFSQSGNNNEALSLYFKMVYAGLSEPPNHYTFSCLLHICASILAAAEGKQIHTQIIKSSLRTCDICVLSSLLHMYAKCGFIFEAEKIFYTMEECDLAIWNAMINGFALHGFADAAIELYHELLAQKDLEPNHITFVGILSACNHKGMVEEGYRYFTSIREPTVDHYACMINLVARAGQLEEAVRLLGKMPFEPNEYIWTSLLAASYTHRNIELGELSAKRLIELNPKDRGAYTALSNIYAAQGRWNDAKRLKKLIREQAVTKSPGFSWLWINQREHVFLAGEGS